MIYTVDSTIQLMNNWSLVNKWPLWAVKVGSRRLIYVKSIYFSWEVEHNVENPFEDENLLLSFKSVAYSLELELHASTII